MLKRFQRKGEKLVELNRRAFEAGRAAVGEAEAACGGVIWSGVLLSDPLFHEFGLESVAGGSPAVSEAGGEHRPVSVKVENGVPCLAIAVRKVATTAGPVTGRCAVTDNA